MIGAILIIAGCGLDYQDTGEASSKTVLVLSFNKTSVKTILPDVTMDVASYDVTGTKIGDGFSKTVGPDGVLTLEGLTVGTWLIEVDAKNDAGVIIADGDVTTEILAGQVTNETITVTPVEGDGTLNITIDWTDAGQFTDDAVIMGSLTPASGSPVSLSFDTSGEQTAILTNTTWAKGYYTLSINLTEGDTTGSYTDIVRIVYNATTTVDNEIMDIGYDGGLILTIINELDNPIAITFAGVLDPLTLGENMTVTAITDPSPVDSYQWYLDGELQAETTSSITIGSELLKRDAYYRLTLIVTFGDILSSESVYFHVGECSPPPAATYQAEDGTYGGGGDIIIDAMLLPIGIGQMHNPGAWNEVVVDGGSCDSTEVTLTITYATGADGVTKSLYVNDADVMQLTFSNVGWTNFVDLQVNITLTAGDNTIRIQNDADDNEDVNIDAYTIGEPSGSSSSTPPPSSSSVSSDDDVVLQAEDGTYGGGAEIGEEGGVACIVNMHNPGAWNEITVNSAGGSASFTITYACGAYNNANKNLYINGALDQTMSFDNIGWTTWTDKTFNITLNAGDNTIRIQNDDGSAGVNLNKYTVGARTRWYNIAYRCPARSSSNEGGGCGLFRAQFAVDGEIRSRWSSEHTDPQWIRVDLLRSFHITRVILKWENAYGSQYEIQTSPDDSNWTTIYTETSGDGGIDDITLSGTGQYIRMYGIARGTEWGYSLWEFEIYE